MLRTKFFSFILVSMLILNVAVILVPKTYCNPEAVRIVPATIVLGDASGTDVTGQEFSIAVVVEDIVGAYGGDVIIQWDTTYFEYVSHNFTMPWNGSTLAKTGPSPYLGFLYSPGFPVDDTVNTGAGIYSAAYACSGDHSFTGDGTMCSIKLRVKDQPLSYEVPLGSYITIANAISYCKIVDNTAADITPPTEDGIVHLYSKYAEPPPSAKISVDPEEIIDSRIVPCNNFTIDINLEEVVDLYSFQFELGYNSTILETANVTVNSTFTIVEVTISEPEGQIRVNGSLESPSSPIDGDLTLASITFHTIGIGETILDLHNVTLLNQSSGIIDCDPPTDGYFNNMLRPKLYVYPEEIIDPNLIPGSQFNISIRMEEVVDFYGYQFNLTYDSDVLNCLGVIIIPPNNDTHFKTEISAFDGNVWVNVTYYPPAEPITIMSPETIVEIYFQVRDYGCTPLDLTLTKILDSYGQPIPHDVGDGFFCVQIRDVAIIQVEPSINATYPKRTVNVTVVAINLGERAETFDVTAYYDDHIIGTQTVIDLAPGENVTLSFIWDTTGVEPCHTYITRAEASEIPYEINVENNVCTGGSVQIKMLGDVNGDGIIDITDLVLIAAAYRSTPDDPNWNPQADLAPPYGYIDIVDVVTASGRYRQTCP